MAHLFKNSVTPLAVVLQVSRSLFGVSDDGPADLDAPVNARMSVGRSKGEPDATEEPEIKRGCEGVWTLSFGDRCLKRQVHRRG